ncbi:MAG: hypothetical protein GTO02_14025 [Candidatus Dadabacteria bacterium]|nr:hypothetical protein [Candidatus Dadabacteria bacterium]NIQ15466.1 hypothetical protein [Candidatus Dadabacteria bacterium]
MKKLLLATVLGLSLTLPVVSNAGQIIFGVETPVEKNVVNSNVLGGYVASNFSETLVPQKLHQKELSSYKDDNSDNETYIVFGIDLKNKNLI